MGSGSDRRTSETVREDAILRQMERLPDERKLLGTRDEFGTLRGFQGTPMRVRATLWIEKMGCMAVCAASYLILVYSIIYLMNVHVYMRGMQRIRTWLYARRAAHTYLAVCAACSVYSLSSCMRGMQRIQTDIFHTLSRSAICAACSAYRQLRQGADTSY